MARFQRRRMVPKVAPGVPATPHLTKEAFDALMAKYGSLKQVPPEVLQAHGMTPQPVADGISAQGFRSAFAEQPPTKEELRARRVARNARGRKRAKPLVNPEAPPIADPDVPERLPESDDVLDSDGLESLDPDLL